MSKPILLMETWIAGTFAFDVKAVAALQKGQDLRAVRDPARGSSHSAIAVETTDGVRVGWIPTDDSPILARLMDGGKHIDLRLADITKHGWRVAFELHVHLRDEPCARCASLDHAAPVDCERPLVDGVDLLDAVQFVERAEQDRSRL